MHQLERWSFQPAVVRIDKLCHIPSTEAKGDELAGGIGGRSGVGAELQGSRPPS